MLSLFSTWTNTTELNEYIMNRDEIAMQRKISDDEKNQIARGLSRMYCRNKERSYITRCVIYTKRYHLLQCSSVSPL